MRIFFAVLIVLLYFALCYACWRSYRRARRKLRLLDSADAWLIAYASQSGTASALAWQTADQLQAGGVGAQVVPLNQLGPENLQRRNQILFIVSTFGEGEAPDSGSRFLARLGDVRLHHLTYGILALGDRDYRFFCGFGHSLNQALHLRGATSLFDLIEVDKGDPAALRHWQYYLGRITGVPVSRDWNPAKYDSWRLVQRRCLNPGSPGGPAFWLQLRPTESTAMRWVAGDIAEIGPCNTPARVETFLARLGRPVNERIELDGNVTSLAEGLRRRDLPHDLDHLRLLSGAELVQALPELPHREYSIASTPAEGTLDLLVRQVRHGPDDFGLGSGWLTNWVPEGGEVLLRVRSNPGFHPPLATVPLILIGNGTGMAGLRAHLAARREAGAARTWLLFGERTAACDQFFKEDLRAWQADGTLEFVDLVFSRDAAPGAARYVQDLLPARAERLLAWVDTGAAIYVCGSLKGMAQGVDEALERLLGRARLDAMAETRLYCRDVY